MSSPNEESLLALEAQIQELEQQKITVQNEFDKRLLKIDSLKSAGASENTLTKFTAVSFGISQKLERLSSRLKKLAEPRQQLRAQLYQFYSRKIDSLAGRPKSNRIEQELFVLMGKRLRVSPLASRLQFNPQQLNAITASEQDSLAQLIYREYLTTASSELDREIKILLDKEQELAEIAALESKAEEFMQEMEESGMIGMSNPGSKSDNSSPKDFSGYDESSRNLVTANEQALSFFRVMYQIQNKGIPLTENQNLSYEQLLQKFREARQLLQAYQLKVLHKLKSLPSK